ncbi:MAG: DUF4138 domain-containing protein [Bacteroidota bacterium]
MRRSLCVIVFSLSVLFTNAQSVIKPRALEVTANKTTNLVFPAAIGSVDRGSERIVVQKSTGNVLRVKADSAFSDTTNLTVITVDGRLYSFLVSYTLSPAILNIDLGASENVYQDTAMLALARTVLHSSNRLHGVRYGTGKVWLSVLGMYTNGSVIACKLKIENGSPLSYEIGKISARLGATQMPKRRAMQEKELPILLCKMESPLIRERQAAVVIMLLTKSGLAPGQSLQIMVQEKGGERHLLVSIPNRHTLNAFLLP